MLTNLNLHSNTKNQQEKDNEIIVKPIVYGSVAFWLGKKADDKISHKWSVYVRGINNEDISYFVKEVEFTLHASFDNYVRVVKKWPFELYESGWGQFDIIITIHLIDETAKPIEFVHPLKLYPSQAHVSMSTKKPVVSESYDEIIFVNPRQEIREVLLNPPMRKDSSIQIPLNFEEDRKSMDYSSVSHEDKMQVERNMPSGSDRSNLKKESSLKFTTNDDKNSMNLNLQMDAVPSQIITQNLLHKTDDEIMEVENFDRNLQIKDDTTSMNAEIVPLNINPVENMSMTSAHVEEKEKKGDEKERKNTMPNSSYIPNVANYYGVIDDTPHFKILEDANKFVMQEINRLRKSLEDTDKEISNVKKNIKEITTKY